MKQFVLNTISVQNKTIPFFLREIGKYYWNKKRFKTHYKLTTNECIENNLNRTFRFFNMEELLFEACKQGKIGIIKFLIENGADIHVENEMALRKALWYHQVETVKFLVENGANIHALDEGALRWATIHGHFDMVKFLVEKGADIHAKNDLALQDATEYGHSDIVEYFNSLP